MSFKWIRREISWINVKLKSSEQQRNFFIRKIATFTEKNKSHCAKKLIHLIVKQQNSIQFMTNLKGTQYRITPNKEAIKLTGKICHRTKSPSNINLKYY